MYFYLDGLPVVERQRFQIQKEFRRLLNPALIIENRDFSNHKELIVVFEEIIALTKNEGPFTITICCHGEAAGLIVGNEREKINWANIIPYIIRLKSQHPQLIIILCVCEGASLDWANDQFEPFIVGFTVKISFAAAIETAAYINHMIIKGESFKMMLLKARMNLVLHHEILIKEN